MRIFHVRFFLGSTFCLVLAINVIAADSGSSKEYGEEKEVSLLISFADSLLERGQYYQAMMEYERCTFLYPHHPATPRIQLEIAHILKQVGDSAAALREYLKFISLYPGHPLIKEAEEAVREIQKETE